MVKALAGRRLRRGFRRSPTGLYSPRNRNRQEHAVALTRFSNPKGLSKPPGYTHVVEVTGPARVVYLAGQLGIDETGQLVSREFRDQAVQVFENLKAALDSIGARFQDVVKLNNYLASPDDLPVFREVRDRYLDYAEKPASTTLAVAGFARPGALLETEAIVALPAKAASKAPARPARGTAASGRSSKIKPGRRKRK
jgi:enamine deaminase RidA (YjgF/YER057c/UK114 family)